MATVPVRDGRFEAEVNLKPEQNTLEARTEYAVSNPVEVFLLPTISIDQQQIPTQDGFAHVRGTVENSNRGTVKLGFRKPDGQYGPATDVPVLNGMFTFPVPLEVPIIWVKAFIDFNPPIGMVESDEVSFTGSQPPPDTRVVISQPADWTDSEMDTVSGTIEGTQVGEITLLVNGLEQQPVKVKVGTRSFTSPVRLAVGNNYITTQRYASNPVSFERKQPVVTIISPKDGEAVFVDTVQVTGTAADSRSKAVKLTVNDRNEQTIHLSGNDFSSKLKLKEGTNIIRAFLPNAAPKEVTITWEKPWDPLESTCRHASLSIL